MGEKKKGEGRERMRMVWCNGRWDFATGGDLAYLVSQLAGRPRQDLICATWWRSELLEPGGDGLTGMTRGSRRMDWESNFGMGVCA